MFSSSILFTFLLFVLDNLAKQTVVLYGRECMYGCCYRFELCCTAHACACCRQVVGASRQSVACTVSLIVLWRWRLLRQSATCVVVWTPQMCEHVLFSKHHKHKALLSLGNSQIACVWCKTSLPTLSSLHAANQQLLVVLLALPRTSSTPSQTNVDVPGTTQERPNRY